MQGKKIFTKPNLENLRTPSFKAGELVWATWGPDSFLYPAIITAADAQSVTVAYMDGDQSDVPVNEVFVGELALGTHVSVNYRGRGAYYFGRIVSAVGMAYEIDYQDGDHGMTTLSQIRLPLNDSMSTHMCCDPDQN